MKYLTFTITFLEVILLKTKLTLPGLFTTNWFNSYFIRWLHDWLLSGHYFFVMTGQYYRHCKVSKAYTICVQLDSGHQCYGQLTAVKRVPADQCNRAVSRAQVHTSLR